MGKEIERKFLIEQTRLPKNMKGVKYTQVYIAINEASIVRIGIKGNIIMETKNMFVINTENGKKNIPKNICELSNKQGLIQADPTKVNKRPHERLEMLVWHEILELK